MAEINFYLRDQLAEKTTIYVYASYDGYRTRMSTDIRIQSKFWNSKKQKAKEVIEFADHVQINSDLIRIKDVLQTIYIKHKEEGIILDSKQLKDEFYACKDSPVVDKKVNSFWDHFENFVDYKRKQLSDIRDYHNSLRKHLTTVEKRMKRPLTFKLLKDPKQEFIANWEHYLKYEALNSKKEKGVS